MRHTLKLKNRVYLAAAAGMLASILLCQPLGGTPTVKAWWGTMYPAYCFSAPPLQQTTQDKNPVTVKYTFRFLKWLE